MPRPVTLGVLSPFFGGEYLGELMAQLYHSAQAHGARVIAVRTGELTRFNMPVALEHVDGWIIALNAVTPDYLKRLVDVGRPVASIAHNFNDPHIVSVESDNESS
ncbi:MAG TPA: hypothetical protein VM532_14965, partial [Burkholderiales bacterium]|nr:hypothetical protein [Burkholderiales bacterium]